MSEDYIILENVYGDELNALQNVLRRNGYDIQISGEASLKAGRTVKLEAKKTNEELEEEK